MKGSKWLVLVVILVVVGLVAAKQMRKSLPAGPQVAAHASGPNELAQPRAESKALERGASSVSAQAAQEPVSKPKASASANHPDGSRESGPAEGGQTANPKPEPATKPGAQQKPAPGPKPEGPLPGSKLKDCLKNGLPTMADFGMGTCKPCKAMEPILKQAAQDYWGRANIVFVELDKYPDLGRQYGIRVMPTQVFFDSSGELVDSHMGYMERQEIDRRLAALGVKQ